VAGRLDTVERFTLADETIGSAKLALRWLREQAVRVANGLDPDPDQVPGRSAAEAAPAGLLLVPVTDPAGDVPAELRTWATDPTARQLAREQLTVTGRIRVTVADSSGRYWLTAQRVAVAQPAPAAEPDPPRADHRRHARHGRRRGALAGAGSP
jgi:hypothetical protein